MSMSTFVCYLGKSLDVFILHNLRLFWNQIEGTISSEMSVLMAFPASERNMLIVYYLDLVQIFMREVD